MNKEKLSSMGYLIASVICLFVLLGVIAWHYYHDHHGDTRSDSRRPVESSSGLGPTVLAIGQSVTPAKFARSDRNNSADSEGAIK